MKYLTTVPAIFGGRASSSSSQIDCTMTLMMELQKNPALEKKLIEIFGLIQKHPELMLVLKDPELMNAFNDPALIKDVMQLCQRLDPEFVKTLPSMVGQLSMYYENPYF